MTTVTGLLSTVYPSSNATGIPLNSSIEILFSTEIDEWSFENGGLVLEGPDTDQVIYPGYAPTTLIQGSEQEILQSPGLKGLVPGVFKFYRYSTTANEAISIQDTTGAGNLYRTKAVFTPSYPLKGLTDYYYYLVGDSDDTNAFGLKTRSVFDVITGSNVGNGRLTFSGTYLGNYIQDTLNIRITKAGLVGEAEFEYWTNNEALELYGPATTSTSELPLINGITVQFIDGQFELNDTFTVLVKKPTSLTGTGTVKFTTGNGSITAVPVSTSTSILGDPAVYIPSVEFKVLSTSPDDLDSNLDPSKANTIVVNFSSPLDPASFTSDDISIYAEPVIDHPNLCTPTVPGLVAHTITVSGSKLTIHL